MPGGPDLQGRLRDGLQPGPLIAKLLAPDPRGTIPQRISWQGGAPLHYPQPETARGMTALGGPSWVSKTSLAASRATRIPPAHHCSR